LDTATSAPARGFTWSGFVGLDLPRLVRGALELGYKGLGIDVTGGDEDIVRNYDMTHYWPFVGFRLHWGR
jgi:hypothetical protein